MTPVTCKGFYRAGLFGLAVVAVWQGSVGILQVSEAVFPSPRSVAGALIETLVDASLPTAVVVTFCRVAVGYVLAIAVGLSLGLVLGYFPRVRMTVAPWIELVRPISPIAWIPIALLWFGLGNGAAVFIIFLAAVFPILLAMMAAVRNLDPIIMRVVMNYETAPSTMLLKVVLPAAMPYAFVGMRISLSTAWLVIVAAEMTGIRSGLGYMIWDARNFLRLDLVVAVMILVGGIGLMLDKGFQSLEAVIRRHWRLPEVRPNG